MTIQVFDCEQGSPEWHACRLAIPTSSEFATVMAKGRDGGASKTRRTYMLKLIGQRMTGRCEEGYTNGHMERGKEMEAEARDLYAMVADVEPQRVGFIRNGNVGCSPDSLVGSDGMSEIKTKLPHLQLECILADKLPPEHKAQCQGNLWVAEREWIDFVSYWPALPLFVTRVYRDDAYITEMKTAIADFLVEMEQLVTKITKYRAYQEAA